MQLQSDISQIIMVGTINDVRVKEFSNGTSLSFVLQRIRLEQGKEVTERYVCSSYSETAKYNALIVNGNKVILNGELKQKVNDKGTFHFITVTKLTLISGPGCNKPAEESAEPKNEYTEW